ncbi:MAG: hypothetical protein RSD95_15820 [Clostridia bacterium]
MAGAEPVALITVAGAVGRARGRVPGAVAPARASVLDVAERVQEIAIQRVRDHAQADVQARVLGAARNAQHMGVLVRVPKHRAVRRARATVTAGVKTVLESLDERSGKKEMAYVKKLSETDTQMLQRLSFEMNGYDVLIREFMQSGLPFNLDKDKWEDVLNRRNRLMEILQTIITEVCDHDYTGVYEVDFSACEIRWE